MPEIVYLVKYILTYSLVAKMDPGGMEDLLFRLARSVREKMLDESLGAKKRESTCLALVKQEMMKLSPSDNSITAAIEELYLEQDEAAYLIERLASKMQSPNKETSIEDATLEHIFPQRPNTSEWPNLEMLSPYLWHLGNLTMLGKNINATGARNKAFSKKKLEYAKSELEMVKRILHYKDWTAEAVIERAKHLAKPILEIWNFENTSRV